MSSTQCSHVATILNSEDMEYFHLWKKNLLGCSASKKKLFVPMTEEKMAKLDFGAIIRSVQNYTFQTSGASQRLKWERTRSSPITAEDTVSAELTSVHKAWLLLWELRVCFEGVLRTRDSPVTWQGHHPPPHPPPPSAHGSDGGTEGKGGYMLGGIPLGQSLPFWELSETEWDFEGQEPGMYTWHYPIFLTRAGGKKWQKRSVHF